MRRLAARLQLLALLVVPPAFSAAPAEPSPADPVQRAAELLESGRPGEALALLRPAALEPDAGAAALYYAGRAAAAVGELEEAAGFLERSLALEPGSPAVRELGVLRAREGRYGAAYELLKPWTASFPDDLGAAEIAALCAVQLSRPGEAEALLARLPQDQARVQILWSRVRLLRGDPWGAMALLTPLLETTTGPMQRDVRGGLAEAYLAAGEAAEAAPLLEGHVEGDPARALLLARARSASGDRDAALALLRPLASELLGHARAAGTTPIAEGPDILHEYGRSLAVAGRDDEALPFLEAAARLSPDDAAAWEHFGRALAAAGRGEEAAAALARSEGLLAAAGPDAERERRRKADLDDPASRELRRAMALAGRGDYEAALRIARREAALSPQDPRPRLLEGRVLLTAGRAAEAARIAEDLVAAMPRNADALYLRGIVRAGLDDPRGAERDLRAALAAAPSHTAAMSDLAVLLTRRGETAEARALLERVLALDPADPQAGALLEGLDDG